MMHLLTFTTAFLLACNVLFAGCFQDAAATTSGSESSADHQMEFDFGPFKFEASFNETKMKNKLRLSKSYFKWAIINKMSTSKEPYLSMKKTRFEELLRCDDLNLKRKDRNTLIDCQPLQSHFLDNTYSTVGISEGAGNYIRRSSVVLKRKSSLFADRSSRFHVNLYPLRNDVIQRNIESSAAANNISPDDYSKPSHLNLGYYFEITTSTDVFCTGDLFLSVNRTEIFARLSNDPFPEYVGEINYLIEQGQRNGYLLSLQNVQCTKPGFEDILTLNIEYVMAQKLQFPYLTVNHQMFFSPLKELLKYEGQIKQVRHLDEADPSVYNTSIDAKLISAVFPSLSFKLKQIFVNKGQHDGFELMHMAFTTGALEVTSQWDKSMFTKELALHLTTVDAAKTQLKLSDIIDGFILKYSDKKLSDYANFELSIRKDIFERLNIDLPQALYTFVNVASAATAKQNAGAREEL